MNVLARCRAYAGHPDPAAAATNVVALVVALNGPFYPLYIIGLIGWAGVQTFATMASSPLFFAVPWLSRRRSLAGRAALPLIGIINTIWCAKLLGVASGIQLFCLPCTMLAALLYRDGERWLGLALIGLALLAQFMPGEILDPPLLPIDAAEAARLGPLNEACIGMLMGLLALQFRGVFCEFAKWRDGR